MLDTLHGRAERAIEQVLRSDVAENGTVWHVTNCGLAALGQLVN